ncbi:MAG TPA: phospholipase D-like domain-containing protein [Ktedonobacterales bacterium]
MATRGSRRAAVRTTSTRPPLARQPIVRVRERLARLRRWRPRPWRLALEILAALLTVQAVVLAVLSALAAQRKRRSPERGFPYLEPSEIAVEGNALQLYSYGQDLYDDMIAAIDGARETVFMNSFIWKGDAVGRRFKDHLARKAAEGVRVCVIFDRFANFVVPRQFQRDFPNGIEVLRYWPFSRPWHVLDPRHYALDHRKLLVVDGHMAFIGGYNIGQLYATKWRDTHLRIVGPEAADAAQAFVDFWDRHQPRGRRLGLRFPRRFQPAVGLRTNDIGRLVFPIRDMYIAAIDRAQDHIYITNAYFIPDRTLLGALIAAARRGVDVQILVPWISNHIAADWAARGYFDDCLRAGIRIFAYKDAMIHAKTATIDGVWSTLGTANLDRLSEVGNYEINVEIYDAAFARQMELLFDTDKTNTFELTSDHWRARPWYVKASELLLAPLRPAL